MAELSGKVIPVAIEDEIRDSYLTYAMSVIVSRALPDVRDGLKPVHRRLLYAMDEMGLRSERPYKKTARLVGDVLGKYHPHGDQALYDALVRLAQDFSLRYPVVDGQGNFGSIDGDPPAAMRYTEARLAPISEAMLRDLGKETVDFAPNYDDSLSEPSVLPGAFPFLLANGGSGIAVGMATNIPPHNLREIAAGVSALIDNPKLSDAVLMKHISGPDFPTGGVVFGRKGIQEAYTTGKGKVVVRGRATVESLRNGRQGIIVTEIPFQVNKANLIIRIADLVKERRLEGIADLRDESDRHGMRIVIEVRRRMDPRIVLNKLFSLTQLQDSFGVNMLALDSGKPAVLTLKQIAQRFIEHRREVVVRRTKYDLRKAEEREHILEGLKIALDNIDAVIKLIRQSRTVEAARAGLRASFKLSIAQAQAILSMQLQRLTSLEVQKVVDELAQVRELIKELRALLASPRKILTVVKRETNKIAADFGDDRRTEIIDAEVEEFNYEDLIEEEDMVVLFSNRGIVKRIPATSYRQQSRGGKGSGSNLRGDDFITKLFIGSTHDHILLISSAGKAYWLKVHELPERTRQTVGVDIRSLVAMEDDETPTAIVSLTQFAADRFVFMATAGGVVKKVRTADFSNAKTRGIAAINLDKGDRLVSAMLTDGSQDVVLVSQQGKALRFAERNVRPMGRASRGVTGIRLRPGDRAVAALPAEARKGMVIMSERGLGKRLDFNEIIPHGRGTGGQFCYKTEGKAGAVAAAITTQRSDDVVCITQKGQIVKVRQKDVPTLGRAALGVKIVAIRENDAALALASVAKET